MKTIWIFLLCPGLGSPSRWSVTIGYRATLWMDDNDGRGSAYYFIKAKFHYTDTDTDFFAAKRTRMDPTEFRRKKVRVRVRVRVVEFSYDAVRRGVLKWLYVVAWSRVRARHRRSRTSRRTLRRRSRTSATPTSPRRCRSSTRPSPRSTRSLRPTSPSSRP